MPAKRVGNKDKIYFWERISFRIAAGFLLPIIVSAYALYSVSTLYTEVSETKEHMQRTWNGIRINESKAILTITKMRMHAQAYQHEASPELAHQLEAEAKDFLFDMNNSRHSLESLAAGNGISVDTSIKKSYDENSKRYEEFTTRVGMLLDATRRGNTAEVATHRLEVDRLAKDTEQMLARLHAQSDGFEITLSSRLVDDEERTNRTLIFYLIAVFVFGVAAAAVVSVSITFPVKSVLTRIKDIATGDGDLTRRVHTRAGGEMTELALWLNVFLDKTAGIISTISNASATVQGTTVEVGRIAESMTIAAAGINKNMMEQSMNIDECTSRVGSIDDLIQNAGESTRQAASLSKIAMDRALQGGASVHETIEAMEKIEETARKVEELVSSINEIASQTNLLAINAAIEATKAGEHGKGFAVVAEEVRKLAERARKLTSEVTGLVGESSGRVKAGVGLARAAGVSLDGIIKDVEAVVSLIQRIASASAKQTESSTVALEFMQKVAEAVRLNLEEMEGVTKATESTANEVLRLNALVGQLNEVVGQFRLDENLVAQNSAVETETELLIAPDEFATPPMGTPAPEELRVNSNVPGELSFESMMNPQARGAGEVPPPFTAPARVGPAIPGLPPLPPGANPTVEGDEDA
ncbi:MAG: methyl-accepting chemotaxis protein, partial [Bdellovibrionota bacterium]